ncbi:MAG: helix-turn-helix domain-containing protein [Microgenomates group bacterium]|jgi:DNA-binding winged helix-turn-helix (wHTH) protein
MKGIELATGEINSETKTLEKGLHFHGFSYVPEERIASSEWVSCRLSKTQGSILEILLKSPGNFVARNNILEQMHKTAPEFTDISNALRSHVFRLRGRIEELYGLKGDIHQDIPVIIEFHKKLGYRMVESGESTIPEHSEGIFSFVERSEIKSPLVVVSGLLHDYEKQAAFVEYDNNAFAKAKLGPTLNLILTKLMETPESYISYQSFYDNGFETRKQLGDQVKLLRKRLIDLYIYAKKDPSELPLPKASKEYGHTLTLKHKLGKK